MRPETYPEIFFKTHRATIRVDGDKIYCFKYVNDRCDFDIFTNYDEATEWIINPFPTLIYKAVFDNYLKK